MEGRGGRVRGTSVDNYRRDDGYDRNEEVDMSDLPTTMNDPSPPVPPGIRRNFFILREPIIKILTSEGGIYIYTSFCAFVKF